MEDTWWFNQLLINEQLLPILQKLVVLVQLVAPAEVAIEIYGLEYSVVVHRQLQLK
jgi:hypothetical protein